MFPSLTDSNSEIEIHYHPGHSDLPPGTVYPGTPSPEKCSVTDIVKIRAGGQNHRFLLCFFSPTNLMAMCLHRMSAVNDYFKG